MTPRRELIIDDDARQEVANLADGVFAPLGGFLTQREYRSVVETMRLANGAPWTIPITLDIPEACGRKDLLADTVLLRAPSGDPVAELVVDDVFRVDAGGDAPAIFGTRDREHPGVAKEMARSPWRVGGRITAVPRASRDPLFPEYALTPADTRAFFRERGWTTVTGFQTRNAIHRAHEYLQRIALEVTDGLFIHPLVGWKKEGDLSPLAVVRSYEVMLRQFYATNRVAFGLLRTPMRYAGPREAVFHALIRRNFGCTHFIVGRDHAGVGAYYAKYEAQALCRSFTDLGITILPLCGPYYCERCATIVTEKTCPHGTTHMRELSGTAMRALFARGKVPPSHLMRAEVSDVLRALASRNELFCTASVPSYAI